MKAVGLIRQMVVWSCSAAFGWEKKKRGREVGAAGKRRGLQTHVV